MTKKATKEEILEEQKRINRLRFLVDFTISVILQGNLPLERVHSLVEGLKKHAVTLFPGKEDTFELIYRPRINRAIMERYKLH
jgi:hemerythrin-like domain-containing protein